MTRTVVPSPIVHALLDKNNYEEWSLLVKTYLLAKDLWDVVEATTEPPRQEDGEVEFKAWRKSNAKALHTIQISCGADTLSSIMGASTAKVAWDILAEKLKPAEASQATGNGKIFDDHTNNDPNIVEAEPENDAIEESPHEGEISHDHTNNNPTIVEAEPENDAIEESPHEGEISHNYTNNNLNIVEAEPENDAIEESPQEGEISHDYTNNNLNIVETEPENDAIEESPQEGDELVNTTISGFVKKDEWEFAMQLLKQYPKAVSARHEAGMTILHWAVFLKKVDIANELVELMSREDLEIQDDVGLTALHYVINSTPESVELAKRMVEKNKNLLIIVLPPSKTSRLLARKITPLIQAQGCSHKGGEEMARYLYSVTPRSTLNDSECAMLITYGLMFNRFDIAWDLIQRRPKLAIAEDFEKRTPLNELAGMPSAFLSGSSLNFWEQWIYDGIPIKPMPTIEEPMPTIEEPIPTTDDDVRINVEIPEDGDQSNKRQRHLICSGTSFNAGTSLFRGLVVKTFGKLLGTLHYELISMEIHFTHSF